MDHKGVYVHCKGVSFYVVYFCDNITVFHKSSYVTMLLASHCDANVALTPMPVHLSIADTHRKLLCKFQVHLTNSSRVTAILYLHPSPSQLLEMLTPMNTLNVYTTSISCSGIVVQAPINVPLLTYNWNAPDQM